MTRPISSRLDQVGQSATMMFTQRAAELSAMGKPVVRLSAGEPDFPTPPHIVTAAKQALDAGQTRYTPIMGIPSLRAAIARESTQVRNVPCTADQVMVCAGAKQVIYNFLMAMVSPGDEVIIPVPSWVSYVAQVQLAGGVPVTVTTSEVDNWQLSCAALESAVTPRSKVLMLNTPLNPTGSVYSKEALERLVNRALGLGLYVLVDEIYRDLLYDNHRFWSALPLATDHRERVFVVDGASKTYAMTGWRIGWGIGDPQVISAMGIIQGQSTSNATTMAQVATVAAIEGPHDYLESWRAQYTARRDRLVTGLNELAGVQAKLPEGAFYVFANMSGLVERLGPLATDVDLAHRLLEEALVATVPGTPFGAPGYVRFSYTASMGEINCALERMADFVQKV